MNLKLCSFNCRGMQDHVKRRKLFQYFRNLDSDVIFFYKKPTQTKRMNVFGNLSGGNLPGFQVIPQIVGEFPF